MELIVVVILATVLILGYFAYKIRYPPLRSDVPITYELQQLSDPNALEIENLAVAIIRGERVGFLGPRSVVEFTLSGKIRHGGIGWRPQIKAVQIAQRWISLPLSIPGPIGTNADGEVVKWSDPSINKPEAEIFLTPVVGTKRDPNYKGEEVLFQTKIQIYVQTTAWGENFYIARSNSKEVRFKIQQFK